MSSDPNVPPPMHETGPAQPQPAPPPPPPEEVARHQEPGHGGPFGKRGKEPRSYPPQSAVRFTKTAAAWWALIVGALTLIVLLVFIAQNLDSTTIQFLGWQWETPTGIALLVAAICGSLITFMTGGLRMLQLRRMAKKNLQAALRPPPAE
ncbi:MAG: hypothetical protein QOH60_1847 [Mycobacterium sp.]|jgi:uncharacterized integral membrane protein|nr:hypothetical protein [Mycobacterium sp.]